MTALPVPEMSVSLADGSVRSRPLRFLNALTSYTAELGHVGANKWFAGAQCWPPDTVEIFDISDPATPVLEASLPFADAASLFGRLSGGSLIMPTASGFSVKGVPVQP